MFMGDILILWAKTELYGRQSNSWYIRYTSNYPPCFISRERCAASKIQEMKA